MANNIAVQDDKSLTRSQNFKSFIEKLKDNDSIKDVISSHITPERIAGLILGEVAKNPALMDAFSTDRGRASIVNFFRLSSELGLPPGSTLGFLYPTPRKNKGNTEILPVVGYKGLCELARRSGQIQRINAKCFYREELERGFIQISEEPPNITHQWNAEVNKDDDNLIGAYAVVETKDGAKYTLVMSRDSIIKRASRGGSYQSSFGPWKTDFAAMARKTVLRSLLSGGTVPISTEIQTALINDDDAILEPAAHRTDARVVQASDLHKALDIKPEITEEEPPITDQDSPLDDDGIQES